MYYCAYTYTVHDIKLADRSSPAIHRFDKRMNKFQHPKLVFLVFFFVGTWFGSYNEKQACVSTIDNLVTPVLQKAALQFTSGKTLADNFTLQGCAFGHADPFVVGRQTSLSLCVSSSIYQDAGSKRRKREDPLSLE